MRKISFALITILLINLTLPFFIVNVLGEGENWLTGWTYRQKHTINGNDSAGYDYQMEIIIDYADDASSGITCYVDGNCQSDFDDIRFTSSDGDTLLDYWLEDKTDSDFALFWVEISDDLDSDVNIYIYYGNSTVSSISDGDATFLFFDDFNDGSVNSSKWSGHISSSYADESDGVLELTADGTDKIIVQNTTTYSLFTYNVSMEARVYFYDDNDWSGCGLGSPDATDQCFFYMRGGGWHERLVVRNDGSSDDYASNWSGDTWARYSMYWFYEKVEFYYNNGSITNGVQTGDNPQGYGLGARFFAGWDSDAHIVLDFYAIRKCVDDAPYHYTWFSEETYTITYYFTFYNTDNGTLSVINSSYGYTTISNGSTKLVYDWITLLGLADSNCTFLNFKLNSSNQTTNPYNLTSISGNSTIWTYFGEGGSGSGDSEEADFIIILAITVICFSGFIVIIYDREKRR